MGRRSASFVFLVVFGGVLALPAIAPAAPKKSLDQQLKEALAAHGFTGRVEDTLETRLGRPLNPKLVELGRNLFFDTLLGLHDDNSCAGCHSPAVGFGDSQPIAIGIDNNGIVGPDREGPRNQRRTPQILNSAFFPRLMWNSRFFANSNDPFDNSAGFTFPAPEGDTLSHLPHLMTAQAFIPPTERNEMAGFEASDGNDNIRAAVMERVSLAAGYRPLFQTAFPGLADDDPISYEMLAAGLAEFQISLVFARAPIDLYARGQKQALTDDQKKGALLFFGKAKCVQCHSVAGASNEMFSDFTPHVLGVPQVVPDETNSVFDGDGDEDFGLAQITGDPADRYKFRTSPLRNIAIQAHFFHNGAFDSLEDAIRHHLDVKKSVASYSPRGRLPGDMDGPLGPMQPVLANLDPLVKKPIKLSSDEFRQLVSFVRFGLLDSRVLPRNLAALAPTELPSGREPLEIQVDREHFRVRTSLVRPPVR
ncbi:MAG: cytochrome c peroxidase [Pirellulaceae bacterium]|nr:cytochrome c peroxidase [Pirellulaceae bacterium]